MADSLVTFETKPEAQYLLAGWRRQWSNGGRISSGLPRYLIEKLEAHLKTAKTNYQIEWYPDTVHGFVFPERDEKYHKLAAERHWEVMFEMFGRNLSALPHQ